MSDNKLSDNKLTVDPKTIGKGSELWIETAVGPYEPVKEFVTVLERRKVDHSKLEIHRFKVCINGKSLVLDYFKSLTGQVTWALREEGRNPQRYYRVLSVVRDAAEQRGMTAVASAPVGEQRAKGQLALFPTANGLEPGRITNVSTDTLTAPKIAPAKRPVKSGVKRVALSQEQAEKLAPVLAELFSVDPAKILVALLTKL